MPADLPDTLAAPALSYAAAGPAADADAPAAGDGAVTPDAFRPLFEAQRAHAAVLRRTGAAQRTAKIARLREGVLARRDAFHEALHADFRKPGLEVDLSELQALADEARFVERRLASWMRPQRKPTPPALLGTTSEVRYEPKGVALILAPWNYPRQPHAGPARGRARGRAARPSSSRRSIRRTPPPSCAT